MNVIEVKITARYRGGMWAVVDDGNRCVAGLHKNLVKALREGHAVGSTIIREYEDSWLDCITAIRRQLVKENHNVKVDPWGIRFDTLVRSMCARCRGRPAGRTHRKLKVRHWRERLTSIRQVLNHKSTRKDEWHGWCESHRSNITQRGRTKTARQSYQ